jgi:hypothetical protein
MSIQKNLCQFVLHHVGNCINLCQFGESFLLVEAEEADDVRKATNNNG